MVCRELDILEGIIHSVRHFSQPETEREDHKKMDYWVLLGMKGAVKENQFAKDNQWKSLSEGVPQAGIRTRRVR